MTVLTGRRRQNSYCPFPSITNKSFVCGGRDPHGVSVGHEAAAVIAQIVGPTMLHVLSVLILTSVVPISASAAQCKLGFMKAQSYADGECTIQPTAEDSVRFFPIDPCFASRNSGDMHMHIFARTRAHACARAGTHADTHAGRTQACTQPCTQ